MEILEQLSQKAEEIRKQFSLVIFETKVKPLLIRYGWSMFWGNGVVGFENKHGEVIDNKTIDKLFNDVDDLYSKYNMFENSHCSGLWDMCHYIEPTSGKHYPEWTPQNN